MDRVNIEIKARCSDPAEIKKILKSKNAVFKGKDHQIDIYFKASYGRLKLREGKIENFLIFYERQNIKGPKKSTVILFKTEPNSSLRMLLTKALGVLGIIEKQREIYFIDNVKFHIDNVKNLGTFIEIEAIDKKGTIPKEKLLDQCKFFLSLFKISEKDLIAGSYCDLLLEK